MQRGRPRGGRHYSPPRPGGYQHYEGRPRGRPGGRGKPVWGRLGTDAPHNNINREVRPYSNTNTRPTNNDNINVNTAIQEVERKMLDLQRQLATLRAQGTTADSGGSNSGDPKSSNEDFTRMVKSAFRYVQIQHHAANWSSAPKGISKAVEKVVSNIKPPMPKQQLTDELAALGLEFGEKISACIRLHLCNCKSDIEQELLKVNKADSEQAVTTAAKQLTSKMGKRLKEEDKTKWLTEIRGLLATEREGTNMEVLQEMPTAGPLDNTNWPRPQGSIGNDSSAGITAAANFDLQFGTPNKRGRFEVGLRRSASDLEDSEEETSNKADKPGQRSLRQGLINVRAKTDTRNIKIDPKCKLLILGDSNVQRLKNMGDDVQVESLKGARFSHMTDAINGLELTDTLEIILVAAGINHRDANELDKEVLPSLHTLTAALRRTRKEVGFLEVSIPPTSTTKQYLTLSALNKHLREDLGDSVFSIRGVDSHTVKTISDGIHYDTATLNQLAECITNHFFH